MSELMQACVEVWESDPEAYAYNPVGYIALGPEVQAPDLAETFERQERIGYRSTFVTGEAEVDRHMQELFPDWRAKGVTACLHEFQGGFAFNKDSVEGLAGKARGQGAEILTGVEVTGLELGPGRLRHRGGDEPGPARGRRAARHRARSMGEAFLADARAPDGDRHSHSLRGGGEGPADVDVLEPAGGRDHRRPADVRDRGRRRATGHPPRHDAPLVADDGRLITDELWGIYFKRDRHGVQGGASPLVVDGDVELDPYPSTTDVDPASPTCGAPLCRIP
jgi:hypothetical protein